ncbi:unnamed protein product [Effrenium voratum]|uniref:Uncharacterized protein n=1 Tax=Effrenium voratum TaxID=2562239 RepID=A0AA36HSA3_9DINO|nr:unnamed protein product [Effrenium voratum]
MAQEGASPELPPGTPGEEVDGSTRKRASQVSKAQAGLAGLQRKNHGAAVKMDAPRTGRRMSGAPPDMFEAENLDDVLKSLISTQKMDTAWQRIGRRVAALENSVEALRGSEGDDSFITRKEFIDFLKSQEEAEAARQAEAPPEPEEEEEEPQELPAIVELRESLKAQEEKTANALKHAMDSARKADNEKWRKVNQLEEALAKLDTELANEHTKSDKMEAQFLNAVKDIQKSVEDLEDRMKYFAVTEARKITGELLFARESVSEDQLEIPGEDKVASAQVATAQRASDLVTSSTRRVSVPEVQDAATLLAERREKALQVARQGMVGDFKGPGVWREALMNMVDIGLMQPMREEVEKLQRDLVKQREAFEKKIRAKEKEIAEVNVKGQKLTRDLRDESDARKGEAIENVSTFQKVYKLILECGEKAAQDTQHAIDRVRLVQSQVDQHAVQLDGHKEDIAARATLEDRKQLTESLQKCVAKEVFSNQLFELKEVLQNQGEKVANIDMQVSVLAKGNGASPSSSGRRGVVRRGQRLRVMKRDASKSSMSAAASTALGQDSTSTFEDDKGRLAGEDDQEGFEEGGLSQSHSGTSKVSLPLHRRTASGNGMDEDEYYDEDSEEMSQYSEDPVEEQLREQVQGICMGLVCLAQHVLRGPPLVGLSRQNRLLNEKELLEELLSLRYWVTHRRIPPDWSLDRLTTVALKYSNPNPMEVHGPQPDMINILRRQASPRDGEKRPSRHPLDTSVGSIGISGGVGSSAGGGAGIFGGPIEDATLLPSPASKLPVLEGSQVVPIDKVAGSSNGWRSLKMPMSARELRSTGNMASTLPPLHS